MSTSKNPSPLPFQIQKPDSEKWLDSKRL